MARQVHNFSRFATVSDTNAPTKVYTTAFSRKRTKLATAQAQIARIDRKNVISLLFCGKNRSISKTSGTDTTSISSGMAGIRFIAFILFPSSLTISTGRHVRADRRQIPA